MKSDTTCLTAVVATTAVMLAMVMVVDETAGAREREREMKLEREVERGEKITAP